MFSFFRASRKVLLPLAVISLGALAACEEEGPAERAGEKVDDAIQQAGESVDKAVEKTGEAIEKAGDKVEQSTK